MVSSPILVVDDEPDICKLIEITLDRIGLNAVLAGSVADAKAALSDRQFSMCLTDMRLPDGDGLDLVSYIASNFAHIPVAMITAHGSMDTAIDALKRGAFDFLTKPIDIEQLKSMVQSAVSMQPAIAGNDIELLERKLVGQSGAIVNLRKLIVKVARSQAPVFIYGESGAGKEVCARCIHELGSRSQQAFVAVNCGAIPAELVESEFFGHKKGSFTGADKDKKGLFESANHGTLMLDEIADLPLSMQVKLLRAIQEKSIRPIGSNEEFGIDVRLLSATHRNLQQLVNERLFRDDLFYRINVIELNVPPLRERSEDIPALAAHILAKIAGENTPKRSLTDAAIERLCEYRFPGNIRELENTLERSIALCEKTRLDADDLIFQSNMRQHRDMSGASSAAETNAGAEVAPAPEASMVNTLGARTGSLDDYLETIEKREIMQALESCRWNRTEAAKLLGISFRSLRYRLNKLGIES
ncbi:MAG: sigma-54 dependent transcriptional regulator [Gammaproteobacteria bacterium]|nr:sigma-54 dependent transcriptional regulator [Gammaproteobacteria bacterium]NNL10988.1 sigma-54-dependent Fis family transcriptional regulator [Pseudomonadales bacterium]